MDPLMSCDRIKVHIRKHICKCKYLDMNIMKSNATYKKQHYHQEGTGVAVSVVETKQLEKIQINWLRLSNCAFQFSSKRRPNQTNIWYR